MILIGYCISDSGIIATGLNFFKIDFKGHKVGSQDDVYAYEGRKLDLIWSFANGCCKQRTFHKVNRLLELAAEKNQAVHLGIRVF